MIVSLIIGIIIGAAGAAVLDALLRGRDPRSFSVLVAGIVGAIAGVAMRRSVGNEGLLVEALTALLGALLLALAARVRISATIARAKR